MQYVFCKYNNKGLNFHPFIFVPAFRLGNVARRAVLGESKYLTVSNNLRMLSWFHNNTGQNKFGDGVTPAVPWMTLGRM